MIAHFVWWKTDSIYILFSVFFRKYINELSLANGTKKESSATSETECRPLIIVGFQIDFLIVEIGRGFLFKYYDRYFFSSSTSLRIDSLDPLASNLKPPNKIFHSFAALSFILLFRFFAVAIVDVYFSSSLFSRVSTAKTTELFALIHIQC